ncbi:MAG: hypothetical protein QM504_10545 [Pseudomonadota bacterium]
MTTKESFTLAIKIVPPILLMLQIVFAFTAKSNPIADIDILLSEYDDSYRLLIGFETKSTKKIKEIYLLINPNKFTSHTVIMELINGQSEITTEEEGGFISYLITQLLLLSLIWWAWFKPNKGLTNSSS